MSDQQIHAVTGAFGYSGKYIAKRLLNKGRIVRNITNSTNRENSFGNNMEIFPFNFDNPEQLVESLRGAKVLYNTYWVRFNHKMFKHADAVTNTLILFDAAKKAGVERIVHVSITNPSLKSDLEYFKGKALLEKALTGSGISHSILRPAVLFGKEDILINNIAWMLRKFPVFGVFGDGKYGIQPIYVDDLAKLAVEQGESRNNSLIDAIGPETFAYRELVGQIANIIGKKRPIISIPPQIGSIASVIIGKIVGDIIVTREEIKGLLDGTLITDSPPQGKTKLTEWAKKHAETLGMSYTSELARRKDRRKKYFSN